MPVSRRCCATRWQGAIFDGQAVTAQTLSVVGLAISALALAVSAVTAWLTLMRRGRVLMTQPTVIYFGPDGGSNPDPAMKVFLRTLLYTTSKRGQIVENMFVRLQRGETRQNLNIWVYGEKSLVRGSGLFIPETGVAANHHFLPPPDREQFTFSRGSYSLEVFIKEVGDASPYLVFSTKLDLSAEMTEGLSKGGYSVYFDLGPDSGCYHSHLRPPPQMELGSFMREMLSTKAVSAARSQ